MKKLIEDTEDGLTAHISKRVTFFCMNYIYTGKLVGVNETCVRLDDAGIVYETGPLGADTFQDLQTLPHPIYVQLSAVEMWCELNA